MDTRKTMIAVVVGYTAFIVLMTQTFAPQGYQELATESAMSRIVCSVALFVGFLIIAAIMLIRGLKWIPTPLVVCAIACVLVSQLLFFLHNQALLVLQMPLQIVLHAATGLSFSVLFSFWAGAAYMFDRRRYQFCILAGSLLSAFIVIFISSYQSDMVQAASKLVALIVVLVVAAWLSRVPRGEAGGVACGTKGLPSGVKGLFAPIMCTGALGFAYQYCWMAVGIDAMASVFFSIGQAFAVSIVLLAVAAPGVKSLSIARCFRLLCPVACLFVLLQAFTSGTAQVLCMGIVSAAFNLCIILLLPLCTSMAKRKGLSAPGLYAGAAGVVYMFVTLGSVVSLLPGEYTGIALCVLAFVVLAALFVALVLGNDDSYDFAVVLGNDAPEPSEDAPAQAVLPRDYFASLIAEEYGLTKRETEVLCMMLLGRDAPTISDELCISANTTKTHIKRIYTKLDIHSRQELADMVEDFERLVRQGL